MASFLGRNSFSTDYDSNAWLHILLYILYLDYHLDGHRFLWKDMTKGLQDQCNDKTPFVVIGEMLLECQNSKDRNKLKKEKYQAEKENKQEVDIMIQILISAVFIHSVPHSGQKFRK